MLHTHKHTHIHMEKRFHGHQTTNTPTENPSIHTHTRRTILTVEVSVAGPGPPGSVVYPVQPSVQLHGWGPVSGAVGLSSKGLTHSSDLPHPQEGASSPGISTVRPPYPSLGPSWISRAKGCQQTGSVLVSAEAV